MIPNLLAQAPLLGMQCKAAVKVGKWKPIKVIAELDIAGYGPGPNKCLCSYACLCPSTLAHALIVVHLEQTHRSSKMVLLSICFAYL